MYECMLSVCMSVNVYTSISLHLFMYMKYILVICFSLYIRLFIVYNAFDPPRILGSIVKVNVRKTFSIRLKVLQTLFSCLSNPLQIRKIRHTLPLTNDVDMQPQ